MSARVGLEALDDLWFQISGTLCNLTCHHCFISCSPTNHSFELMDKDQILQTLEDSKALGVKAYYYTGGEPFMHPDMVEILERTLAIGPATVLTNGTLLKPHTVERLAAAEATATYSLELRVSIDGPSEETNDAIRGQGAFARAMEGVRLLLEHGFLPIITVAQTWDDGEEASVFLAFVSLLRKEGYARPRIKLIPTLRIGAEAERTRGYHAVERVTEDMLAEFDRGQLLCTRSRMVTDQGVFACPILIEAPEARMGARLEDSLGDVVLNQGACYTCYVSGAICSNVGVGGVDVTV